MRGSATVRSSPHVWSTQWRLAFPPHPGAKLPDIPRDGPHRGPADHVDPTAEPMNVQKGKGFRGQKKNHPRNLRPHKKKGIQKGHWELSSFFLLIVWANRVNGRSKSGPTEYIIHLLANLHLSHSCIHNQPHPWFKLTLNRLVISSAVTADAATCAQVCDFYRLQNSDPCFSPNHASRIAHV